MYTRLVPAAAAQSDCSMSSPNFTGLARLLDYISQVRFCTQAYYSLALVQLHNTRAFLLLHCEEAGPPDYDMFINFGSRCTRHNNYDTQTINISGSVITMFCLYAQFTQPYTQPEPQKHNLGKLWSPRQA